MGNRATVIFTDGKGEFSPAVYLHWNGGPESIYGFLEELDRRKVQADQEYECARFVHVVGDFFDHGDKITALSLGVANGPKSDAPKDLQKVRTDHSDNGFYLVNRTGKELQMRRFKQASHDNYKTWVLEEMDADFVASEHAVALKSKYQAQFREVFAEITKGKKMEGG